MRVKSRVISVTYDRGVSKFNVLLTKILKIDPAIISGNRLIANRQYFFIFFSVHD